jgi:nucleoside-diphosphate-sugar epimerase
MGTVNILEACRKVDSVKAIINITSDKCYENREWAWGYRETEPMGGYDPYSASKGISWSQIKYITLKTKQPHEANYLKLDCSKANTVLNWKPVWSQQKSINKTANWYKEFYLNNQIITKEDFNNYISDAKKIGLEWVK